MLTAGIDEVGRGPLAGPVVACACIFLQEVHIEGIKDSKQLSPRRREMLFEQLDRHPHVLYRIGEVDHRSIDSINILQATIRAMVMAVEKLPMQPQQLLVDGVDLSPYLDIPSQAIIKGDQTVPVISAASILAKVTRDKLMMEYHCQWPKYGFDRHKGYGTRQHYDAIRQWGLSPIHRRTFLKKFSLLL